MRRGLLQIDKTQEDYENVFNSFDDTCAAFRKHSSTLNNTERHSKHPTLQRKCFQGGHLKVMHPFGHRNPYLNHAITMST